MMSPMSPPPSPIGEAAEGPMAWLAQLEAAGNVARHATACAMTQFDDSLIFRFLFRLPHLSVGGC